jgi:putative ABC transport system permease protein
MVGPRVMIRLDDLLSSELVQRGSIVEYRYRIAARDGMSGEDLYQAVSALTPEAGWELERPSDAGDRVRRTVERTTTFLGMAAIVALSIGLAGSWAAGMAWIARRSRTISLYRLSGAMPGLIAALHGVIMLVAGLIGIVVGLGLAVMLAVPLMQVVSERLHLVWAHSAIIEPLFDVGLALVLGIAGSSLFALSGATRISPGAASASPLRIAAPDRLHALAGLLLVLAALLYATFSLPAPGIAIMVVAGLCIAVVILGMGGAGLARLATLLPATGFTGLVTQQGLSRRGSVAMRSVAIGIGIAGITAIVAAQSSLETALRSELPDRIPDLVLIDVQPDQVGAIRDRIESAPGLSGLQADPFMRMTITAVNDVPAAEALVREDKSWVIEGDRSFSWTAEPTGAELLAGKWWAADYAGPPLLSPEEDLMEAFDLKPGDRLTYSVLGRSFTSEVANIRKEYHRTFRPEYLLVASPEPFRNAPQAWIMSLQGDGSGAVDQLVRDLAGDHPNVTAIDIRQLVTQVAEMIEGGVMASLAVAFTLVLAGGLSLAAVIASDVDARRREALVFSVVGASRTEVAVARLVEALAVGLIAALLGGATGLAGGYWAVEQALRVEWAPGLQSYLLPLLLGLLASASAGLAGGLGAIPRGRGQLARLLTS